MGKIKVHSLLENIPPSYNPERDRNFSTFTAEKKWLPLPHHFKKTLAWIFVHYVKSIVMANLSFVQPEVLTENKTTINSFLKDSYTEAKKQVQQGMNYINESVSSFKQEFSFMYERTSDYLNRISLPVNNFLKDIAQIDLEFQQEQSKEIGQFICMEGKMIPVDQVLCLPMEENY